MKLKNPPNNLAGFNLVLTFAMSNTFAPSGYKILRVIRVSVPYRRASEKLFSEYFFVVVLVESFQ